MPEIQNIQVENITVDKDGNVIERTIETVQVEVPTQEEIIAQKEQELLNMYNELQALKNNNL